MQFPLFSTSLLSMVALLLGALSLLNARLARAQPSASASCWVCPTVDLAAFDLTEDTHTASTITCEFGEPQWHCHYNRVRKHRCITFSFS